MSQPEKLSLSVVIPVYNERDNLSSLTAQILKALTGHVGSFEIIYVDDGSTDGSGPLLEELAGYYLEVRVFHFDRNYGQTSAFDAGFHQAGGDLIATLDGDLQYDPADVLTLLPLAEHYDLVCGWRKDRHDTLVKRLSSRIANAIRNAVIHDGVHDTGCSLKLFHRRVLERIPLFEGMHRFLPARGRMHGFTLTRGPVRHFPRIHGQSKYGIGNRVFKALRDLLAVRWMQGRSFRYRYRDYKLNIKR